MKRSVANGDVVVNAKRSKGGSCEVATSKPKRRKQFPLSEEEEDESKSGVLVRMYDQTPDSLKINEMVRIYGILEHARLASLIEDPEDISSDAKGVEPVPRVHAVVIYKLEHNNPLIDFPELDSLPLGQFVENMGSVRSNLISLLTECFEGDTLSAEYTLLHLVSSSFHSESPYTNTLPALNIISPFHVSGCSKSAESSAELATASPLLNRLHSLLSGLVTQLAPIQVTLDALNNGPNLIPVRDPAKGTLDTGRLQLSKGTQILVDETLMTVGQLQPRGLLNLRALTLLATQRRVPYDFQFYTLDWETDCRMLIVSSGQSLIKPSLLVPWLRDPCYNSGRTCALTEAQWDDMRKFLTLVIGNIAHLNVDESLQEHLNEDFVNWRRNKETYLDADEFSIMLCLLRLLCLTHGETEATPEYWKTVCDLETRRRGRLKKATSHNR